MKENKIKLGITVGDLNGVGGELIFKSFQDKRLFDDIYVIVYASTKCMNFFRKGVDTDVSFNEVKNEKDAVKNKLNVISVWNEMVDINYGTPTEESGKYALKSLEAGTKALKNNKIDCLVTAPVDKENINKSYSNFKGHTEYLEEKLEGNSIMVMTSENLKLGLVTNHLSLKEVSKNITEELIRKKLILLNNSLKEDFNISSPKIAVLGLNPHNGDKGILGKEEEEIINPAIKKSLTEDKVESFGPFSADGFFANDGYNKYDVILAMYHDQGLIPFKILTENKGINFTAGLNKVRTSPSHGTAFDIAGKGEVNIESFIEAIFYAVDIYKKRK